MFNALPLGKHRVSNDLAQLIKMGCGWGSYPFPIVLPLSKDIKKGESFKALILGVDDLGERNLNVYRIEVDGQKLSIIDKKYAYYESKPITDDLSFISIKCYVGNDATGRTFEPTGNYRYPIKAY